VLVLKTPDVEDVLPYSLGQVYNDLGTRGSNVWVEGVNSCCPSLI